MKKLLIGLIAVVTGTSFCLAEGTISEAWTTAGNPNKLLLTWTASTNGWVYGVTTKAVRGEIVRVSTVPCSTNYTMCLYDPNTNDLLGGQGSITSNSVNTLCGGIPVVGSSITSVIPYSVNDILTLSITNCGKSKSGSLLIYFNIR